MKSTVLHTDRGAVALSGWRQPRTCMSGAGRPAEGSARVSIEDLMNIEITSAAKKEQRAEDVPAAVFVITQDDIRRSGLRSLPELFRLVPGMQVAQVNASKWAVSVRGFNDLFSNKLLVLIDGRSILQPRLLRRVLGRRRPAAAGHRPDRSHSRPRRQPSGAPTP